MEDFNIPKNTRLIPLTKGAFATVDAEDYEWLSQWKWHLSAGYASRYFPAPNGRKRINMHQLICPCPPGLEVDHIDRNRLNNTKVNLRAVTRSVNMKNKAPYPIRCVEKPRRIYLPGSVKRPRVGKVTVICETCQSPFKRGSYLYKESWGRFCSVKCSNKWVATYHNPSTKRKNNVN